MMEQPARSEAVILIVDDHRPTLMAVQTLLSTAFPACRTLLAESAACCDAGSDAINTFTLLTFLGGFAVIVSFLFGVRAMARYGTAGHRCSLEWLAWRAAFHVAVFLIVLAAPLSR